MTSAPTRSQRVFTVLAFLAVAGLTAGAFVLSYDDLRLLALAGLKGDNAERFGRYYPAVYDGLVAVALLAVFVARNSPWWVRWVRWTVLFALIGGAIAASVQNALKGFVPIRGTALEAGVASAPWVAALLAIWLWMSMFRQLREGASQRRAGRRARRRRPAHARTAGDTPEVIPGLAEPVPESMPAPELGEQRTDPLRLPTAEDFPNPYRDDYEPAWEPEPADATAPAGATGWEPVTSPWPDGYEHRHDGHDDAEDEPAPPQPVRPEPVRPPASLPTDVKLVGRPEEPHEDALASTTQPDFPAPGPVRPEPVREPVRAETGEAPEAREPKESPKENKAADGEKTEPGSPEDWATYSPERNPPSGSFRSGPTPPGGD